MFLSLPPLLSGVLVGADLKVLQYVLLFKKCRCDKMVGRIQVADTWSEE